MEPLIKHWHVPEGGGVPHLCQPNIPHALHGCLRADAEVLTIEGWKPIASVTTDDTIATWDMDTEKIIWDHPYETVRRFYKQMIRIKYGSYKTFGMLVSPDHRLPIRSMSDGRKTIDGIRYKTKREWRLCDTTASEINLNSFQHFITAARNGSAFTDELTNLERVYIAIQADGSLRGENEGAYTYRLAFKKDRKKERFEELCRLSGVSYTKHNHSEGSVAVKEGYQRYDVRTGVECKNFWDCFDISSFGQIKAQQFLDEISVWDGSCAETCGVLNRRYTTTRLDNAKFAQAVAVVAGVTSSFQIREANSKRSECYIVDFLDRDYRATQSCVKEMEEYDDYAYCINVPTSYFVVRDADSQSVMITGNCNPRTIMGTKAWSEARTACYEACGRKCEICGADCPAGRMDAHELYEMDYERKTCTFVRLIGLCKKCHGGVIHSGRAITMYKNHMPLWTKPIMLEAAEHGFQLVQKWNKLHPDEKPLRMFSTIKDWLKEPSLTMGLQLLIDQYGIEFYDVPPTDTKNDWGKWKLIYEGAEYLSPYKTEAEWEAAMQKRNRQDQGQNTNLFEGELFDKLREMREE